MANYQVADGWDNEGALADLTHQPRCEGLPDGRRRMAGDQATYSDADLVGELVYDYMTKSQKATTDSELGVASAKSNEITITLPYGANRTFSNWNAIVEQPSEGSGARFDRGKWINVRYPLRRIHAT